MLSITEKKAIFVATKSAFTVSGNAITCGHQYSNEKLESFPRILLNYPEEGIQTQKAVGNVVTSAGAKGQRELAQLSINVYAKQPNAWNLNYNTLAGDITDQLIADINTNWTSLSSGTVKLYRVTSARKLTDVEAAQGNLDTARYQFDVYLLKDKTW